MSKQQDEDKEETGHKNGKVIPEKTKLSLEKYLAGKELPTKEMMRGRNHFREQARINIQQR